MKKITLAEKIRRAEARVVGTEAKLSRQKKHAKEALDEANQWHFEMSRLIYADDDIDAANKRWFWQALDKWHGCKFALSLAQSRIKHYKAALANQKQYLRKLQAAQAKIDAENAEEDAYIDAMITLAGAIA